VVVGHFSFKLPQLGSGLDVHNMRLASHFGGQPVLGAVSRMLGVGTCAIGLAATTVADHDGATPEVADLGKLSVQATTLRLKLFQVAHDAPPF
jgi:hypothetical protein